MSTAPGTFIPPTSTSYPAVFQLARECLEARLPTVASMVLDEAARNIAAKMDERQLAPAAFGDKRRPHYTHAAIGCDGVSVNLCFRDGSAEFVFREEEMDLVNEEGRDLYVKRVPASEILALRQALIDYLPADEAVEDRAVPAPSLEAMKAAVELEIQACIGRVTTRGIGELIDRVAEARVREAMGRVPALAASLVQEIDGLFSESEGVAGLHQNGDVAPWSELEPGGEYERLTSLNDLRAALAQGEAARG